jgi:DNA-binding NtrC family response regulator/CHASE2 domain-containing sensor protein
MINIDKIIKDFRLYKILAIVSALILPLLFPSVRNILNSQTENIFLKSYGSDKTDTNIVIIRIDETTINSLQGWPLKRSFYALAFNYLRKLNARKIGLEVFLGNRTSAISIYNRLLVDEINQNPNVILSALLNDLKFEKVNYISDSLVAPDLNAENLKVNIGHINYLQDDGFYIPVRVLVKSKQVNSFSSLIADKTKMQDNFIRLKINHSWRDYRSVEFVDFLKTFEQDERKYKFMKNKIILIGVTDELIAKSVEGVFDYKIPGVGFHAIAVDNLLNNEFLNTGYKNTIAIIFLLILLTFTIVNSGHRELYYDIFLSFGLILSGFVLYVFFDIYLNYTVFILPALFIVAVSMIHFWIQKKELLSETVNENKILNEIIRAKEIELTRFQEEISKKEIENQSELIQKIEKLKSEIEALQQSQQTKTDEEEKTEIAEAKIFQGIVYNSGSIEKIVSLIKKVAPQDVTILILGESGTGKELIANAIHNLSKRKQEKFIAVNCAALTETLLESELFGHVRGAFTNAIIDKKGIFETANNGTVFLDEIGETSENFQSKLLRVLQSGEVQKVGSTETIYVNVRIIAATNKNLEELVKQKKFREDLFYRLNVIPVNLPALRERKEDIPFLAKYFAEKENKNLKISQYVIEQLMKYDWKGNIRELESVIKRAAIFAISESRDLIKLKDLPENVCNYKKLDLDNLILNSLREKKFSHSSINETAAELGNINRAIVSEHLRGMFFRSYVKNDFDFSKAVVELAESEDETVLTKLSSKCETYISNIEKDVNKLNEENFDDVKTIFASKYKNLPSKYHEYLDKVIREFISKRKL